MFGTLNVPGGTQNEIARARKTYTVTVVAMPLKKLGIGAVGRRRVLDHLKMEVVIPRNRSLGTAQPSQGGEDQTKPLSTHRSTVDVGERPRKLWQKRSAKFRSRFLAAFCHV